MHGIKSNKYAEKGLLRKNAKLIKLCRQLAIARNRACSILGSSKATKTNLPPLSYPL